MLVLTTDEHLLWQGHSMLLCLIFLMSLNWSFIFCFNIICSGLCINCSHYCIIVYLLSLPSSVRVLCETVATSYYKFEIHLSRSFIITLTYYYAICLSILIAEHTCWQVYPRQFYNFFQESPDSYQSKCYLFCLGIVIDGQSKSS